MELCSDWARPIEEDEDDGEELYGGGEVTCSIGDEIAGFEGLRDKALVIISLEWFETADTLFDTTSI